VTDIANLLREAAQHFNGLHARNKQFTNFYRDFAKKLEAAADSLDEPVAWLWDGVGERAVTLDADEADGMWKPLYLAAAGEKL
jgi:hypothetical protein